MKSVERLITVSSLFLLIGLNVLAAEAEDPKSECTSARNTSAPTADANRPQTATAAGTSFCAAVLRDEVDRLRENAAAQQGAAPQATQPAAAPAQNGTDPRDMSAKFMPYYRFTKLTNRVEQQEFVLFGMFPLAKGLGLMYEIPLGMQRDATKTDFCAGLPEEPCGGTIPPGIPVIPGGIPDGLEGDGREVGVGDMNLKVLGSVGHALGGDWILGGEIFLPTATDVVLGSETLTLSPIVAYVRNLGFWPGPAFLASMNLYRFDVLKDTDRSDIRAYVGRHFFMLPLHPSGIYALPEVQTVYDFESEHFSFWIGPEVGKMIAPGHILYVKPGWGIGSDENSSDRDWSLELGYRIFL